MRLPVEPGVILSLFAWCATWPGSAAVDGKAASDNAFHRRHDNDWLKDLLKYDFENRIWNASSVGQKDITIVKVTGSPVSASKPETAEKNDKNNVTLHQTFINKVENVYRLPEEYSEKLNAYYADTPWPHGTAAALGADRKSTQYAPRPITDLTNIGSVLNGDYSVGSLKSRHRLPHSNRYISTGNREASSTASSIWDSDDSPLYTDDPYSSSSAALSRKPTVISSHVNDHVEDNLDSDEVNEISETFDDIEYETQEVRDVPAPKRRRPPLSRPRPINKHHSKVRMPRPGPVNSRKPPYYKKDLHRTKNKLRPKPPPPDFRIKHRPGPLPGSYKDRRPHRKPGPGDQIQKSSKVVIHVHDAGKPAKRPPHRRPPHRRPPHPLHHAGGAGGGLWYRARRRVVSVVGGVLLAASLAALGYLIWLTPPTLVTYSKRQRAEGDDLAADLLAAPFELRRLTELSAQLSEALAEAQLVALKLRRPQRWRRCHRLQLCRALVEGLLVHRQPVWIRYIRAAPWLWLFGLDAETATRLQELAHRPDFRSCRPFFKPCDTSQD